MSSVIKEIIIRSEKARDDIKKNEGLVVRTVQLEQFKH